MRVFRVALTGDFLDETGAVAYGDIGLDRLASQSVPSPALRGGSRTKAKRPKLLVTLVLAGNYARSHQGRRWPGRSCVPG